MEELPGVEGADKHLRRRNDKINLLGPPPFPKRRLTGGTLELQLLQVSGQAIRRHYLRYQPWRPSFSRVQCTSKLDCNLNKTKNGISPLLPNGLQ